MAADPVPFEIVQQDGRRIATNGASSLSMLDEGGMLFKRRAVKGAGTDQARRVEWAVAELNGVRVYFDGTHVMVTAQDLMP